MKSSNEDLDDAIQKLLDLMQIPAPNRRAAAPALLKVIEGYKWQNQWTMQDAKERFLRILELCNDLLKELEGVPPALHFLYLNRNPVTRSKTS